MRRYASGEKSTAGYLPGRRRRRGICPVDTPGAWDAGRLEVGSRRRPSRIPVRAANRHCLTVGC